MNFRFTLAALFFFVLTGFAQTGTIAGTITEESNGEVVIGAVVIVDSLPKYGAVTDFDGKYSIRLPEGTYKLTCHYTGYSSVSVAQLKVVAGKTTPLDFVLASALNDSIPEIIEYRDPSTTNAILDTIRKSDGTVEGLGKGAIGQTTETTAGGVAKKIPGVTIVDGRFIVVRGLSERYNAVLLNNVFAPSAETDVKAFAFDLVPSSMIENFFIYKSPSADLPGEFAGGVIRINTTDIPDHNVFSVGYAGGFRSGTTFQPFNMNKGNGSDFFAAGAKSRALPESFPSTSSFHNASFDPNLQMEAGKSLSNNWNYITKNAPADIRFNMAWENRYSKSPDVKNGKNGYQFGNITAFNYSNTYSSYISNRLDYNAYDSINQKSDTIFHYTDSVFVNSTRVAFVQNNALRFGKGGSQRITLKNLFNQMGDNETTLRGGVNHEFGTRQREYSYRYTQRSIYTGQLNGLHQFNSKRTTVDWTAAYSLSRRSDPDWRKARYTQDISTPTDPYYLYIANSPSPSFLGRIFINMHEDIIAGAANYTQAISLNGDSTEKHSYSFKLKTGFYLEQKARTYTVRNLGYVYNQATNFDWNIATMPLDSVFLPQHINDSDGIKIADATKKADQYTASNSLQAAYLMGIFPIGHFKGKIDNNDHERVRISGGVRLEHNVQRLNSNTIQDDTVIVNNDILSVLPSVNVAWNFSERMLVRAAYGRTLNRPEFREIAPLYFYDFLFNSINTGNSALKTPSIENYDARWEFYPRPGENITVGAFYKKFTNPIEVYFIPGVGSGGTRSFTWGNAPEAHNYGVEIEVRKKLDSLNVPFIRNLSIVANAALIKSEITLADENIGLASNKRPMMGQSPYIINAGLFYQNDSIRLRVNVMYNVIGQRIVIVGVPGVPEVYEMPRHQLDVAIIKTFGKQDNIDLRLNISDLLNQETLLLQDANGDGKLNRDTDQRMQFYKRGTYFTLGVNVRVL